jgi:hypothetical protein
MAGGGLAAADLIMAGGRWERPPGGPPEARSVTTVTATFVVGDQDIYLVRLLSPAFPPRKPTRKGAATIWTSGPRASQE